MASDGGNSAPGGQLLRQVGAWAARERDAPLTEQVGHDATRAVVDWFSATLPGARMEPARLLEEASRDDGEAIGHAVLLTSGRRTTARTAALINGTASHSAELDDIFREGVYHPGSPTVAAALAVAQQLGRTGADLLRAVVIGFEISTRIAANVQPSHYRFWHTTGTIGTLGAAAAAASLVGASADRTAHAIATATTMAAGLQQAFRSDAMSKPLHAGHAADTGVMAAFAANRGVTGALDILEGAAGLGAAMSDDPEWDTAFADLGDVYNIGRITIKNHASCGHTFAAVDGAIELLAGGDLDVDEIERIEIATYGTAVAVAGNLAPRTAFEARFSLAYCVAAALVRGSVRLDAFDDDTLVDPRIQRLVAASELSIDRDFDRGFPSERAARTILHLRDGSRLESVRLTRKGDPDAPLTDTELRSKYDELVPPCLGDEAALELAERLWSLRDLGEVRTLLPAPATEVSA